MLNHPREENFKNLTGLEADFENSIVLDLLARVAYMAAGISEQVLAVIWNKPLIATTKLYQNFLTGLGVGM